jgi:hypothetical protein
MPPGGCSYEYPNCVKPLYPFGQPVYCKIDLS